MGFDKFLYKILSALAFLTLISVARAYDSLDPNGNITIKWDIISWTPDGYVAMVTINNFQMYRNIMSPGWQLGWTWAKKEIIWSMLGAQATDEGDCSKFTHTIPHTCMKTPSIVDLLPGAPYNQQVAKCCKAGVLASRGQSFDSSISAFQVSIGQSGHTKKTVRLPKNFTLLGPGPGYTCGPAIVVRPSSFLSGDGHRVTHAMMTWNVTCTYSRMLASRNPSCCVSLSSFYNSSVTPCLGCACSCSSKYNCDMSDTTLLNVKGGNIGSHMGLQLQCTNHMCPVQVHWHLKTNYKEYWHVKITVTNFIYGYNYTQWTLVVQHPNLNDVAQIFSFKYKPLVPYPSTNDSGLFYGIKPYNDILIEAGEKGNVQSELIMKKHIDTFTLKQGWAFPRKVYFNGDECTMPLPDSYPSLPNSALVNFIKFPSMMVLIGFVSIVL